MKENYVNLWNKLHKDFSTKDVQKYDDWLEEFNEIISSTKDEIIDLGCGVTGNNTRYLLERGYRVISCDFAQVALDAVSQIEGAKTLLFDMLETFPFKDNYTDLIIADLSLHYFKEKDTYRILSEIRRVLKPNGHLLVRLNSAHSTEYYKLVDSNKQEIEPNLFFTKGMEKRFFSASDIDSFFSHFGCISRREENMSRWCPNKIVWKCAFRNIK